jgi:Xaa-Pro aminopeptidase
VRYKLFSPELFTQNRAKLAGLLKPNSLAIFNSNDQSPRAGDQFHAFRQNSNLFYLSGIDQEESMLLLFPGCPREGHDEVLLIKRTNEHIAVWEGHKYTKEEAIATSGIKRVYFLDEADAILNEMILLAEQVYLDTNENDRFLSPVEYRELRYAREFRARYPAHNVQRAAPILKKLRSVKSKPEVDAIQRAIDVTGDAFRRVLGFVRPGVMEYEIEAEITHEFIRNGMTGHGYTPIIGSGISACVLHYIENKNACQDGEVILMDFGAEYANYNADLTRSIPVNGKFTARQRAVYDAVLRVLKGATALLVAGNNLDRYHYECGKLMTTELLALGLITQAEVDNETKERPAYKKYFMHGTSHHLGLDVHDVMFRYAPFENGNVFTCEPGIYIPEENLGIRLENNILITPEGPVDLFKNIPIEADEIEALMAKA